MIYRLHTPRDFEQIATLRWKLKTEDALPEAISIQSEFTRVYLAQLHEQEKLGQTIHWVLETNGCVEGVMTLRLVAKETSLDASNKLWGYLTNVYLTAHLRNKGFGSTLLRNLIAHAKASELEFLLVWPSEQSVAFYHRAGFIGPGEPLTLELS